MYMSHINCFCQCLLFLIWTVFVLTWCHWFYNDFRRGLSPTVLPTLFSRALSCISVWHHWLDRIPELISFVYMSHINCFFQCLFYFYLMFSWGNRKTTTTKLRNNLILFDIAKTNNQMMSSIPLTILGWPGWNSSEQVRLIHMHTSRNDSVTGSTNTLWFVDTFDQLQMSIQHSYPCDLMNMKENILFLRKSGQLLVRLTKLIAQI